MKLLRYCSYIILLGFAVFIAYPVGYFVLEEAPTKDFAYHDTKCVVLKKTIGAFIINLDRSRDRYQKIQPRLKQIGYDFQRVSGVDGHQLSDSQYAQLVYNKKSNFFKDRPLSKGEIGCYLSHMKALQTFLESCYEFAVIFEDDATFDPKKLENLLNDLKSIPKKWDVVNLYADDPGNSFLVHQFTSGFELMQPTKTFYGAVAYVVNRKAARALLKFSKPIKMPFDLFFSRAWEMNYKFLGIRNVDKTRLLQYDDAAQSVINKQGGRTGENAKFFLQYLKYRMARFQTGIARKINGVINYYFA